MGAVNPGKIFLKFIYNEVRGKKSIKPLHKVTSTSKDYVHEKLNPFAAFEILTILHWAGHNLLFCLGSPG